MTSGECKTALVQAYPGTKEREWKRTRKYTDQYGRTCRVFDNVATKQLVRVTELLGGGYELLIGDPDGAISMALTRLFIAIGRNITHCGDYGQLFWNPLTQTIWLEMGDADCDEPFTTMEDMKKMYMAVDCVRNVIVEAEAGPEDNEGYVFVGTIGRVINPW